MALKPWDRDYPGMEEVARELVGRIATGQISVRVGPMLPNVQLLCWCGQTLTIGTLDAYNLVPIGERIQRFALMHADCAPGEQWIEDVGTTLFGERREGDRAEQADPGDEDDGAEVHDSRR